eukprot:1154090-Pelagomonas_calceolata.AAC.2
MNWEQVQPCDSRRNMCTIPATGGKAHPAASLSFVPQISVRPPLPGSGAAVPSPARRTRCKKEVQCESLSWRTSALVFPQQLACIGLANVCAQQHSQEKVSTKSEQLPRHLPDPKTSSHVQFTSQNELTTSFSVLLYRNISDC